MKDGSLIPRFGRARREKALAVLEGLHAVKHALRFGADVHIAATPDAAALLRLCRELAPDVQAELAALAQEVPAEVYERLAPMPPATGVIALAARAPVDVPAVLAELRGRPVVLLEDPRDLGNMGACVRVSAAADAAAVLCLGGHDPWHPDALRGAAGLHYALPVARADDLRDLREGGRPLVALDPEGEPLRPGALPPRAVLAFGSERRGLSEELLAAADARIRIPMRAGVSSLNLATSVAAVLFGAGLAGAGAAEAKTV